MMMQKYDEIYDKSLRFGVDRVISHEMVHQWAGNLVTCAWYDSNMDSTYSDVDAGF